MVSLKEIKTRIASVDTTLKMTSAMRLISTAKLRKTEAVAGYISRYEEELSSLAVEVMRYLGDMASVSVGGYGSENLSRRAVLVVVASDTAFCGAFNASIIRLAKDSILELGDKGYTVEIWPIGRKCAEAFGGDPETVRHYAPLASVPTAEGALALSEALSRLFVSGRAGHVEIIYHRFVSIASQRPMREILLPLAMPGAESVANVPDYIFEPSAGEVLRGLIPCMLSAKVYSALFNSLASQHAARSLAMQLASVNARDLRDTLNLSYNRLRQGQITSELADINQE